MMIELMLAAAAPVAPPPLDPGQVFALECVAVIGLAARSDASLTTDGREFAAVVGARIISRGYTREQVGNLILQRGLALAARPADAGLLTECRTLMQATLAAAAVDAPLPPPLPRR